MHIIDCSMSKESTNSSLQFKKRATKLEKSLLRIKLATHITLKLTAKSLASPIITWEDSKGSVVVRHLKLMHYLVCSVAQKKLRLFFGSM